METNAPPLAGPVATWPREPRHLSASRGASWWSEGWKIFTAAPVPWLLITLAFLAINVVLGYIPVVGSLAHSLLMPVFVGGLLIGCHGLARGRPLQFMDLFGAFQSDRLVPLLILGAVMLGASIVVGLLFVGVMFAAGGSAMMGAALSQGSADAMAAMVAGMGAMAAVVALLGIAVALAFFLAWWFAPALVALNRAEPIEALKASFRASVANLGAVLVFLLILIALAALSLITFGLAWIVLAPVLAGATYAGWREVFGD